jgi:chromosome segregation ATPase
MIEPGMFFGLGFLAAALLALILVPLVHSRAVRLTRRRIEASAPNSIAEMQSDKDQLRAEFAIATRKLEMSVEQLKTRTTSQLADLGKKTAAINALKAELAERTAAVATAEKRGGATGDELRATQEQLAARSAALRDSEQATSERDSEIAKLRQDLEARSMTADSQRIEIVTLKTQLATLQDQAEDLRQQVAQLEEQLGQERASGAQAAREIETQRAQIANLLGRAETLERDLGAQSTEADVMRRRTAEMEPQLLDQEMRMAEVARERDQLRGELAALRRAEAGSREQFSAAERQGRSEADALRTDKALLEAQLQRVRDDRAAIQRELTALKREAESSWDSDRKENAVLRERINDVAAEIARLTAALETDSPIGAMVAQDAAPSRAPERNSAGARPLPAGGTLADRIRLLQARAPRAQSAR